MERPFRVSLIGDAAAAQKSLCNLADDFLPRG